ncbi:MAG TPA: hypothetical protein VLC46_01920 [Thermoanaerobaculia bacterium]|jgi:hypothetical protein|nr:hypothetical protein [Thermoanaerobaculia bacterium]
MPALISIRLPFLAVAALLVAGAALADEEVTHPFATAAARGHVRRVVIDIPAGEVRIRNGAPDRIAVSGMSKRHFDGYRQREKQQRIADDISAEVVIQGDEAIVRRHFGPAAQSWNARSYHSAVDLTIDIPPGVDVDLSTRYGSVDIDGAFGNIDTDLRAGEVHVRTPRANVRDLNASVSIGEVHTYFGDRYIENEGVLPRAARFHNAGGQSAVNVHTTFGEVHVTLTQ